MIRLENINKVFIKQDKKVVALKDISIQIDKGDIYGIIGSSGAGKSTLIRTINLLERPTSGSIRVAGTDLLALNNAELLHARKNIGMIFQHFNLLSSRTVFENIAFPIELTSSNKQATQQKVDQLLSLVDLTDKRNDYPANLSGGQKQRVAIARALATDPEVLLCDEATSALDPMTTRSILALLKKINKELNITIVLITHEMQVIRALCNKVAVIAHGEIIEENTVGELFDNPQSEITKDLLNPSLSID